MSKFKVHLQQYVEKVTTIEVEAASISEARGKAMLKAPSANWEDGDDSYSAECYAVDDETGNVWER